MGKNEDSLLRAAGDNARASATRGGSCTHPDQSRGLARRRNLRAISGTGASAPILPFFLGGGVPLHDSLVGKSRGYKCETVPLLGEVKWEPEGGDDLRAKKRRQRGDLPGKPRTIEREH